MSLEYTKTHTVSGYTSPNDVDITFTFDYLDDSDIKVYKTDTSGTALILGTDWQFKNKKEITLLGASTNYTIADDDVFLIQRETDVDDSYITYAPGSAIRAEDLNNNQLQALYSAQEREERSVNSTGGTVTGNVNIQAASIVFEGTTTTNNFETTVTPKDPTADATITVPNLTGHIAILAADPGSTTISSTPAELNTLDGVDSDLAASDLNKINNVTHGTVAASKAVIVDANKDIDEFRNVTATGTVTAGGGSFSGNVAMGGNLVTGLGTPSNGSDAASKTYVDAQTLSASVPAGTKGPGVDALTSSRWQIRIASTPQVFDEDIDLTDATDGGADTVHAMFGNPTMASTRTLTIPSGSTLLILN